MDAQTYDDLLTKYAGKTPDEIRAAAERASARGDEAARKGRNAEAAHWYDVAFALDEMADGQEQRDQPDAVPYVEEEARLDAMEAMHALGGYLRDLDDPQAWALYDQAITRLTRAWQGTERYVGDDVAKLVKAARYMLSDKASPEIVGNVYNMAWQRLAAALAPFAEQDNA